MCENFIPCCGTGDILAPRLLAAFGSDRNVFSNADEVNRCVGIAPVIERSGK
ncbi:MAG: transposase, partial [Pseudomonadales bacterium]